MMGALYLLPSAEFVCSQITSDKRVPGDMPWEMLSETELRTFDKS